MVLRFFGSISKWFKKQAPLTEGLTVEAELILMFDPGSASPAAYTYFLETRVINSGGLPIALQAIGCETSEPMSFAGVEKAYAPDGKGSRGPVLQKKGDVFQENIELKIAGAAQFESAKPVVFVKAGSGKLFKAEIDKKNLESIKSFEAGKADQADTAPPQGSLPLEVRKARIVAALLEEFEQLKVPIDEKDIRSSEDGKTWSVWIEREKVMDSRGDKFTVDLDDLAAGLDYLAAASYRARRWARNHEAAGAGEKRVGQTITL